MKSNGGLLILWSVSVVQFLVYLDQEGVVSMAGPRKLSH